MPTECSSERFDFGLVGRREIVGSFEGGAITSDAGALLLGTTDRMIGLLDRLAACFTDYRRPELIEHRVATLVGQRVFGIALGYEDLNDHDELRRDPVIAVLAGKLEAGRANCAPVAGKPTLNRLELSRETPTRYHKIASDPNAIESLFFTLFLEAYKTPPEEIILDIDATDDPLHGHQEGRTVLPWLLRLLLLSATVRVLRAASVGRQAAAGEYRRCRRRGGADCPHRHAAAGALAVHADHSARRFRLRPRDPDGMM
jgi:hypothetical protein